MKVSVSILSISTQPPDGVKEPGAQYIFRALLLQEAGCENGVVCGSRTNVDETTKPPSVVDRVTVAGE